MSTILASLLSDLEIAVLEREEDGAFTLISGSPSWLTALWPEATRQISGLSPADTFLFLEDFLERNASFWEDSSHRQKTSGVWTETALDGTDILLEAVATFIEGRPLLLIRVPTVRDSLPIYQQAREQRLEYEQLLDEINKREVLLHCIVHDLSNPLAGIKGSLDLLETEEMVDPDASELVQIGLRQAGKMQNLIQGILTTFANEVKPILPTLIGADIAPDLALCAREVATSLKASAAMKNIEIRVAADAGDQPLKVVGEAERLERVLFNLLANAIRHSNPGDTITIRLLAERDFVQASVEDQGPGVPEDLIDSLFDRFTQGGENAGQAGLGLYFCRITVENWGGSIGYRPGDDGGACFWFRLPRPKSYEQPDLQSEIL